MQRLNGVQRTQLPRFCSFDPMTVLGKPSTIRLEGRGNLESRIEKQMRLNSDVTGPKPVTEILKIYSNARASKILDVQIFLLSERRVRFEQTIEYKAVDNGINQYGTNQLPKYVNSTHFSLRAGNFNMG